MWPSLNKLLPQTFLQGFSQVLMLLFLTSSTRLRFDNIRQLLRVSVTHFSFSLKQGVDVKTVCVQVKMLPAEGGKTVFVRLRLRYTSNMADKRTLCFYYFPKVLSDLYNLQWGRGGVSASWSSLSSTKTTATVTGARTSPKKRLTEQWTCPCAVNL